MLFLEFPVCTSKFTVLIYFECARLTFIHYDLSYLCGFVVCNQ